MFRSWQHPREDESCHSIPAEHGIRSKPVLEKLHYEHSLEKATA
jgi:hypothetical protein